jgi:protein TonB
MFFWKNELNKFIFLSLGIHLVLAGLFLHFSHDQNDFQSMHISFNDQESQGLRASFHSFLNPQASNKPAKTKSLPLANKTASIAEPIPVSTEVTGQSVAQASVIASAKAKYFSLITQTIYKNKKYPRQAYSLNQEGLVVVRMKLDKSGNILDLNILEEAPYPNLTKASLETIRNIQKFPPIPDELEMSEMIFRIPIEYKIQM